MNTRSANNSYMIKLFGESAEGGAFGTLSSTSSLLAIFGLAFAITTIEAPRYPIVSGIRAVGSEGYNFLEGAGLDGYMMVAACGLALVAVIFERFSIRSGVIQTAVMIASSFLIALGYVGSFDAGCNSCLNEWLASFMTVGRLCGFLLLIAWGHSVYSREQENSAALMAFSFLITGVFQALAAAFQPIAVALICSISPFISTLFFVLYNLSKQQHDSLPVLPIPKKHGQAPSEDHPSSDNEDSTLESQIGIERNTTKSKPATNTILAKKKSESLHLKRSTFAAIFICFICYGMITYVLDVSQLPANGVKTNAIAAQLFTALGSLSAGAMILPLCSGGWKKSHSPYCKCLTFFVFAIAVFILGFSRCNTTLSVVTSLVDASHKLALFAAWILPFNLTENNRPALSPSFFAGSLAIYHAGGLLAQAFCGTLDEQFAILLICLTLLALDSSASMIFQASRKNSAESSQSHNESNDKPKEEASRANQIKAYEQILFTVYVSDTFDLTRREFEILSLLMEGMKPRDIAEELTVSFETIRSHRRNVFHKLEVNSQEELIEKITFIRENDFQEFIQNMAVKSESNEKR